MGKTDDQGWQDLLANLNPYREPNTENKGQWRPELEKKIAEYRAMKNENILEGHQSFNWLFAEDTQYFNKQPSRDHFTAIQTMVYDGVPAGPIEPTLKRPLIYIANINPAITSCQTEELARADKEGGPVDFHTYARVEDAVWIGDQSTENIIYRQLFLQKKFGSSPKILKEYLKQNTKRDGYHWYAQHVSELLRALFHADGQCNTNMSIENAKRVLHNYPIQFMELIPYRTQNAKEFLEFLKTNSTMGFQEKSVKAYQNAISQGITMKQLAFKGLANGAQVANLPSTQFVLANVIERIRQYYVEKEQLNTSEKLLAPSFIIRGYQKWWKPALQVFLKEKWKYLPEVLKEESNTATLLANMEERFFWTYKSKRNVSVSRANLVRISGITSEDDFWKTFVEPFR